MEPLSIYLHIPFCQHRCAYCDFNTYAGMQTLIPDYMRALAAEIERLAWQAGQRLPVHTIFFGGGTPSLVPVEHLAPVLQVLETHFDLADQAEISLEANPGTLTPAYLQGLRAMGFNRLSLGMQSANPTELAFLERIHDFGDVVQAVRSARLAGFKVRGTLIKEAGFPAKRGIPNPVFSFEASGP